MTVESGEFEIIKDSLARLTDDRRLQALFIAFAFGAFLEGTAGFGTPVAITAAMLAGIGFNRCTPPGCASSPTPPRSLRRHRRPGHRGRAGVRL